MIRINGNADSKNEEIKKHSPACLGDSTRFVIGVSAFYGINTSVLYIFNCFKALLVIIIGYVLDHLRIAKNDLIFAMPT